MADRVSYRKLPGHRRGFLRGASVWLGPGHLLHVRSVRFREEYKRYQLQDIQAIAIARRPRFHISTRAFAIACVWLVAFAMLFQFPGATYGLWGVAIVLFCAWLYVSAAESCTCRIYTAVSRDELPSVYRTWVARRFLRALESEITAAQGGLDIAAGDVIETPDVGPREALPAAPVEPQGVPTAFATDDTASDYLLAATLLAVGLWRALALYHPLAWAQVVSNLLALAVLVTAIWVLVRHRQQKAPSKWLAIAAMVIIGLVYYVRLTVAGALAGARAAVEKKAIALDYSGGPISGYIEMGATLLLGLVGLGILLAGRARRQGPAI